MAISRKRSKKYKLRKNKTHPDRWVLKNKYKKNKKYMQTGKTNVKIDKRRHPAAKKPGWRISKSGKRYYENRRNRSDKSKKKRL